MALDKRVGNIDAPTNPISTTISNEAETRQMASIFDSATQVGTAIAKHNLESEVDSLFENVPSFTGVSEEQFATAVAGGETVTVSTSDHPFVAQMVKDVKSKQRAVDQGLRSPQWYKAEVDRIIAEYTDIAPGLAREFANAGNLALNRNITSERVQAQLAQAEAYNTWREMLVKEGEEYGIPHTQWETEPLKALAKLEAAQNLKYKATNANNYLEVVKARGEINERTSEELFRTMLPGLQQDTTRVINGFLGLKPGASPEAMATALSTRGPEDAIKLQQMWEARKVQLYAKMNANGQGMTQASFDAHMAPMDRQVELAVSVLNGEAALETLERATKMNQMLSENQLYDTEDERRMMAMLNIAGKFPDSTLATSFMLSQSDTVADFFAKQLKGENFNFTKTEFSDGKKLPAAVGGMNEAMAATADMTELSEEDRQIMGEEVANLWSAVAENPAKVHVQNMDALTKAINNDKFWEAVDMLQPETKQRIYDNVNTVLRERAITNDSVAANEYATRPVSSGTIIRGKLPEGVESVRDMITISAGYPPMASARADLPENLKGAAHREAVKFNQNIARRVRTNSEAYAKFLQRTGNENATPAMAYRELYGGRIHASFLREGEEPTLDKESNKWLEEHYENIQPWIENGNKAELSKYFTANGAPESLRTITGI